MEENHPSTNANTPFFREFVSTLNLVILNTLPQSSGLFTHFFARAGFAPSESVLDYGLFDNEHSEMVSSFCIDSDARYLCGSDHAMLTATIEFGVTERIAVHQNEVTYYHLPVDDNYTKFYEELDPLLLARPTEDFKKMSLDDQHLHLVNSLTEVCQKQFLRPSRFRHKRRTKLPRRLVQLIRLERLLKRELRGLRAETLRDPALQPVLDEVLRLLSLHSGSVADQLSLLSLARRRRVQTHLLRKDPTLRKFWQFIRSESLSSHRITAAYDSGGKVVFDVPQVHESVLSTWGEVFSGQRDPLFPPGSTPPLSPDFTSIPSEVRKSLVAGLPEYQPDFHEDVVCRPFTRVSLSSSLSQLKGGKSRGPDNLPAEVLKFHSPTLLTYLLIFYNNIFQVGLVPEMLNLMKCILLHKGGDSLNLLQYRPISVPSCLLRVITVRMAEDMSRIAELFLLLGPEQFGFRMRRSTLDAAYLLSVLLQKVRSSLDDYRALFLDLTKAYDSVWREGLYVKLQHVGFGGRTLRLLMSMYQNDRLQFFVMGAYSSPLWLRLGVKQGCNLSPLLFALFLSGLGPRLMATRLGIELRPGLLVSTLFFADDVVLIARSPSSLAILFEIAMKFFDDHQLSLSVTKTKVLMKQPTMEQIQFTGDFNASPISLGTVVLFKYLGVTLSSRPRSLFKDFNSRVQSKTDSYLFSILSLVKSGPDRSLVALTLWQQVALPSILYGCEIVPLSAQTLAKVEIAQCAVGKFALQVPKSSANVSVHIDAGMMPIKFFVCQRVLKFSQSLQQKPHDYWPTIAFASPSRHFAVTSPTDITLLN